MRKFLRFIRCPTLDRYVLNAGKLLHGFHFSDDLISERVNYMYMAPHFVFDAYLKQVISQCGLVPLVEDPVPYVSLAKLIHVALLMKKSGAAPVSLDTELG